MHEFFARFDWLAFILAIVGFVVWLVRLEGRVKQNERLTEIAQGSVDELRKRHEQLDSELVRKLSRLETAIARIEGYLRGKNESQEHMEE